VEALDGDRARWILSEIRVVGPGIRDKRGGRGMKEIKEMKEKCYRALRIIAEDWLENLFKERRQTRDLGERDRLTGKIEELQRILENLKEEKEE